MVEFMEPVAGEPPPRKSRAGYDWEKAKSFLDEDPGAWYLIRTYEEPKNASQAGQQFRKKFGDEYEVVVRSGEVWARKLESPKPNKNGGKKKKKSRKTA